MAETDQDRALLIEQLRKNALEQGGVTGGSEVQGSLDQGLAPAPAAAPVSTPAPNYAMRGFEADKLSADPSQQSEKYKIGNVMKGFDPKAGVTPEMLSALNALGIAEFSGSGDKLTVNNTKNDPRFGKGGTGDVVYAHDAQNGDTAWQPWFVDDGGAGAGAPSPGAPMMNYSGGGDSSFSSLAPTDSDFFKRLMAQAGSALGGPQAFDRDALLKMLGGVTMETDPNELLRKQQQGVVPAANPNDPFASIGGGVQIANGGWVPKDHPLAQGRSPMPEVPVGNGGSTYTPPNAAPGTPGSSPLDTQNSNAQTYSQTPGAAPLNNTTNQGVQDTVRNQYLQTIQKGTAVDTNDPNFRQQADAYGAAQERARRNALDDSIQGNFSQGTHRSGGEGVEERLINEQAAQNQGQFEGALVGQELQSRRSEIQNALSSLGGMIDNDQKLALQRELAALDAALKRESLAQTGSLGAQDLDLRKMLGTGALNVDMIRALLQNQQAGDQLGFNASNAAVQNWLRANGM